MAKPYRMLRHAMDAADRTRDDLSRALGRSATYISQRFQGMRSWTLDDIYIILDMLNVPASEMAVYFPNEKIKGRKDRS